MYRYLKVGKKRWLNCTPPTKAWLWNNKLKFWQKLIIYIAHNILNQTYDWQWNYFVCSQIAYICPLNNRRFRPITSSMVTVNKRYIVHLRPRYFTIFYRNCILSPFSLNSFLYTKRNRRFLRSGKTCKSPIKYLQNSLKTTKGKNKSNLKKRNK